MGGFRLAQLFFRGRFFRQSDGPAENCQESGPAFLATIVLAFGKMTHPGFAAYPIHLSFAAFGA